MNGYLAYAIVLVTGIIFSQIFRSASPGARAGLVLIAAFGWPVSLSLLAIVGVMMLLTRFFTWSDKRFA